MMLRDRLLAQLREPAYVPADEAELARRLRLSRKERPALSQEIDLLLSRGLAVFAADGRLALPRSSGSRGQSPRRQGQSSPPARQPGVSGKAKAAQPHRGREQSTREPAQRPAEQSGRPAPGRDQPARGSSSRPSTQQPAQPSRGRGQGQRRPAESGPARETSSPRQSSQRRPGPRSGGSAASKGESAVRDSDPIGRIQFRAGGSAFVVPVGPVHKVRAAGWQISPDETGLALPGDEVVVRVLPGVATKRAGEIAARVLRVVKRGRDTIVGNLTRQGRNFAVVADDPRFINPIMVPDPARSGLKPAPEPGDKVVVRLGDWQDRQRPIPGEIVERLGKTHEPRAELLGIFQKYSLDTSFPPAVEAEVAGIPGEVQPKDLANRLDYRERAVFTIDPDDAKDFDDALSLEELGGGDVRVGTGTLDSTLLRDSAMSPESSCAAAEKEKSATKRNSAKMAGIFVIKRGQLNRMERDCQAGFEYSPGPGALMAHHFDGQKANATAARMQTNAATWFHAGNVLK